MVFFQGIGVLAEYNLGLASALVEREEIDEICLEGSLMLHFYGRQYLSNGKLKVMGSRAPFRSLANFAAYITRPLYRKMVRNCDILHLNQLDGPNLTTLMNSGKPKIFTYHQAPLAVEFEKIVKSIDALVAPSKFTASWIKENLGYYPKVIYHGVNTSLFNPYVDRVWTRKRLGLPPNAKIIFWNSRISSEKDLKTLINAIPFIVKEYPNAFFIIKGRSVDPNYKWVLSYLRSSLKQKGLQGNVRLIVKWIPNHQMPFLYRASDIFVHTSLWENFGLVFVEAMACGIPVIAANATTAPEILGNAGVLFSPQDPQDLAEKVAKLLSDDGLRKRLSKESIQRIRTCGFTWNNAASKYASLYLSVD